MINAFLSVQDPGSILTVFAKSVNVHAKIALNALINAQAAITIALLKYTFGVNSATILVRSRRRLILSCQFVLIAMRTATCAMSIILMSA